VTATELPFSSRITVMQGKLGYIRITVLISWHSRISLTGKLLPEVLIIPTFNFLILDLL